MENVTLAYSRPDVVVRMRRLGAGAAVLAILAAAEIAWNFLSRFLIPTAPQRMPRPFSPAVLLLGIPGVVFACVVPVAVWIFCGVIQGEGNSGGLDGWKKKGCLLAALADAALRIMRVLCAGFGTYELSRGRLRAEELMFRISDIFNLAAQSLGTILWLAALLFMLRVGALAGRRKMGVFSAWVVGIHLLLALMNAGILAGYVAFGSNLASRFSSPALMSHMRTISMGMLLIECVYWAVIAVMAFVGPREVRRA
jgi:hypothetical protein